MKNKQAIKIGLILLPVVVGAVLLFKYFRSPKRKDFSNTSPGSTPIPPLKSTDPSDFPLKNGSKNELVKQLQSLLGVTADGIFGPKTAAALLAQTGKIQITSQTQFDEVIKKLTAVAATGSNTARADQLVKDWKGNSTLRMTAIADTVATEVKQDIYGALVATGKSLGLPKNTTYARDQHVLVGSTKQGFLTFRRGGNNLPGLYKVDPTKISLT